MLYNSKKIKENPDSNFQELEFFIRSKSLPIL